MTGEVLFLTLAEVIEIQRDQITRYGGETGIRDLELLLSALAVPEATFGGEFLHKNRFEMAAAYAFHICKNHPFYDGNKRTALVCALVFLELNGITIEDPGDVLYSAVMKLAEGKLSKHELADIFRRLPPE
ncbi:MAG: type II toxin-antitoxin system death-on-curing family toxin [Desulfotomaculales bacterium]